MGFDELHRLGMPLNLDTLKRQGRDDQMFSNEDQWKCLCRAGEGWDQAEAWGAFVQDELAAYIISIRLNNVVIVLYNHSRTTLLTSNSASALLFFVIQILMHTQGIEAVYNGTEWLTTKKGLDHFKQRMGFIAEPVVLVTQLQPLASRLLLNRGVRYAISSLGPLLNKEFHQRVEAVLEMAELSS
jgi:hypothetical protein